MKKIFAIDWILIFAFLSTAATGIALHLSAENGAPHAVWHNWSVSHIVCSLLFLFFGTTHVKMHLPWFKGLLKRGIKGKSKVTITETLVFLLSVITGIALLLIEGASSGAGKWHWAIGLVLIFLSLLHIIKRLAPLRKSLL